MYKRIKDPSSFASLNNASKLYINSKQAHHEEMLTLVIWFELFTEFLVDFPSLEIAVQILTDQQCIPPNTETDMILF